MIWIVVTVILIIVWAAIFMNCKGPKLLDELKVKYWTTLDALRATGDSMWHPVLKPAIITGRLNWDKSSGAIGLNVNKGYEIYICLDGDDVNSATYVLLHELAHMTVPEYDHSNSFWENFNKLMKIATDKGIYSEVNASKNYCGDVVKSAQQ
jgi:hypothetical protein